MSNNLLYLRLNLHVGQPDSAVIRALWPRLDPVKRRDPRLRKERKKLYRNLIKQHRKARALFNHFRF